MTSFAKVQAPLRWVTWTFAAILLAPLVVALSGAAYASLRYSDDWGRRVSAQLLISETEIIRTKPPIIMSSMADNPHDYLSGDGCGYDITALVSRNSELPDQVRKTFYNIVLSIAQQRSEEAKTRSIETLADDHSQFSIEFLRRCIANSALEKLCRRQAQNWIKAATAHGPGTPFYSEKINLRKNLACTWLDGLAARKGLPLGKRIP